MPPVHGWPFSRFQPHEPQRFLNLLSGTTFKYGLCSSWTTSLCRRVSSNTASPVLFAKFVKTIGSFSVNFTGLRARTTSKVVTTSAPTPPITCPRNTRGPSCLCSGRSLNWPAVAPASACVFCRFCSSVSLFAGLTSAVAATAGASVRTLFLRCYRPRQVSDKPIPASRQGFHKARIVRLIAQCVSQSINARVQSMLEIDKRIQRPQCRPQLIPSDQFPRVFQQHLQDLKRLSRQAQANPALSQLLR
jgi:hypothetical protein